MSNDASSTDDSKGDHSDHEDQIDTSGDVLDTLELTKKTYINGSLKLPVLTDSTVDKMIYTGFMFTIVVTAVLSGMMPKYFYYLHTIQCAVFLPCRYFIFKRVRAQFILLEFCTYTNILLLIYIWFPWKFDDSLFPVLVMFSNGPVLRSILTLRFTLAPHSVEKMVSLFIHISPAVTTWSIRWFSTPEQNFNLCANPTEPGPGGCDHVGLKELLLWPMMYYFIWLFVYLFIIYGLCEKFIIEGDYKTTYRRFEKGNASKSFLNKVLNMGGGKYRKVIFYSYQTMFTFLTILSSYFLYHSKEFCIVIYLIATVIASYHGATFYTDYLGFKAEKVKK